MHPLTYRLVFTGLFCLVSAVYGSENVTIEEVPVEALVNLTGNNELWTVLLKDCKKPTLICVQNNIFKYLKTTLDETEDLQFNNFLKFSKNKLNYASAERAFDTNSTDEEADDDESPIEAMARTLKDNTAKFFMTHDLEVALPDGLLPNSVLKIAPQGFGNNAAQVHLEIVSKDLDAARALQEGGRTFKRIRKFINERIIYALLALLLVIKLLAFKFLFLLPLIVGAATAKKLLLKILLFVFPFLHHVFKFCAYYPIQAKYHHHKHLISHIHQHESYGPPAEEHHGPDTHFTEFDDDVSVLPDDGSGFPHGENWMIALKKSTVRLVRFLFITARKIVRLLIGKLISHRKDPNQINDLSPYGSVHPTRRKPGRPLTSTEIERIIAKAEKEAIIKARLEKERLRIRDENLKLQDQLNQAIKLQEKLKQQAVYLNKKLPPTKIGSSVSYNRLAGGAGGAGGLHPPPLQGSPFDVSSANSDGPGLELPAGYIPQHTVPQRPVQSVSQPQQNVFDQKYQTIHQNHFEQQYQNSLQTKLDQQYQPTQLSAQKQPSQQPGPVYKPQAQNQQPTVVQIQKSVEYDPRIGSFENSKEVQSVGAGAQNFNVQKAAQNVDKTRKVEKPSSTTPKTTLEQAIYQAAAITFDPFYSPILQKIDKILQGLGFNEEPCKERLICSMYKNPTTFSPHSNLLSAELSSSKNILL
ncbi:hypothetical protein YQE_04414, partial [Dendroctonus ponderosae]